MKWFVNELEYILLAVLTTAFKMYNFHVPSMYHVSYSCPIKYSSTIFTKAVTFSKEISFVTSQRASERNLFAKFYCVKNLQLE